jgi:hypothetical protein
LVGTFDFKHIAASWVPVQVMAIKSADTPEFFTAQEAPSGDVRMVPFWPTVTNWVSAQTIELSFLVIILNRKV